MNKLELYRYDSRDIAVPQSKADTTPSIHEERDFLIAKNRREDELNSIIDSDLDRPKLSRKQRQALKKAYYKAKSADNGNASDLTSGHERRFLD